jgi:hypothetical protein
MQHHFFESHEITKPLPLGWQGQLLLQSWLGYQALLSQPSQWMKYSPWQESGESRP